ncbi:MAG TPA: class I SAM-dependent methyltransferase [Candidatus Limnocylindrales bacterium]|nr:class I SAM-dependent methyltransferase [Candidatus Limnocylindrales bacterium]
MNSQLISYDAIWQQQIKAFENSHDTASYWNGRSQTYDSRWRTSTYAHELLSRMELKPDYNILDIGCGTGTMTIPLAARVRHVTALDISPLMLEKLRQKSANRNINNIEIIQKDWNEVTPGKEIPEHDIVLVSRSLPGRCLSEMLYRFNQVTKLSCYIVWRAERRDEYQEAIDSVMGKKHKPYPDYQLITGALKNMGISPGIETFESTNVEKYPDIKDAVKDMARGVTINDTQFAGLLDIAGRRLKNQDGFYLAAYKMKWVLISWHKSTSLIEKP